VQTAHALHQADEVFAKFGVNVSNPELDFGQAVRVEERRGQADDGAASRQPLQDERGRMGQGPRPRFTGPNTIAVEGGEDVTFKSAIVATGSYPFMPPIDGLDSPVASTRPACSHRPRSRDGS
jgi:pyruvate/2-oxoglutarate dehydrogenase complex dihydrolipoamide dehydrogenase (E3) component